MRFMGNADMCFAVETVKQGVGNDTWITTKAHPRTSVNRISSHTSF
jgi:hypothetical protein